MKRTFIAIVAMSAAFALFAEGAEAGAEAEIEALKAAQTNAVKMKVFTALPLCRRVEGSAQVKKPGGDWQAAEEGKFYPLGTSYRVQRGGMLAIAFGVTSTVTIKDDAEFGTRLAAAGSAGRTVVLARGTVELKLPNNLPEGAFTAAAPGFVVKNPAGEALLTYKDLGDGDEAVVRCVTGSLGVEGRHFDIPVMRAANEVRIRTSRDQLSTILYGTSGDYAVKVDQGLSTHEEFTDEGERKTVEVRDVLDWHLTPLTKLVINRMVPAIGERMSVHTMAFDAAGDLKSERSFCEGRAEINSGELVPVSKASAEELAKKAAEMTKEAAEDAEETEEVSDEESTSNEKE